MTQQGIKAIETVYNGYRFRSRLEARWAVFFDTLGVKYEYEKEGFDLGDAGWYLPDFWLETVEMWAEVKPVAFTTEEENKCVLLAEGTQHSVLMLDGIPDQDHMYGLMLWIPEQKIIDEIYPGVTTEEVIPAGIDGILVTLDDSYIHSEHRWWSSEGHGRACGYNASDTTKAAYRAARQARFEHGETPQIKPQSSPDRSGSANIRRDPEAMTRQERVARYREQALHAIATLQEYLDNFDASWEERQRIWRKSGIIPARYFTSEYKVRDRSLAERRLQDLHLRLRADDIDARQRHLKQRKDPPASQDEWESLFNERRALLDERRQLDLLSASETKHKRAPK